MCKDDRGLLYTLHRIFMAIKFETLFFSAEMLAGRWKFLCTISFFFPSQHLETMKSKSTLKHNNKEKNTAQFKLSVHPNGPIKTH